MTNATSVGERDFGELERRGTELVLRFSRRLPHAPGRCCPYGPVSVLPPVLPKGTKRAVIDASARETAVVATAGTAGGFGAAVGLGAGMTALCGATGPGAAACGVAGVVVGGVAGEEAFWQVNVRVPS